MASLSISTGDIVKQGDVIGTIGSTGDGRDSSLEFRVFVPSMDMLENQIDPKLLLPDIDQ
jgi:murein DD-endopeptidase MepM/ murein hydrolase activator NlpD